MDTDAVVAHSNLKWTWPRHVNWLLLLIGPLAVIAAVIASRFDWGFQRLQNQLEVVAPYMVALAAAIYAARAIYTRNPLFVIMTALAAALTMREIHFDWTKHGIYIMLVAVGVWAVLWRKRIAGPLTDWRHTSWLIATLAAYVLSQAVARRAFRFIPNESVIHRSLEEVAETVAHVMLIVTSLIGSWRRGEEIVN